MKITKQYWTTLILSVLAAVALSIPSARGAGSNKSSIWVTAYYPIWEQMSSMPPDKVDYTAFTDIIQFAVMPNPDGSIDETGPTAVTKAMSEAVISRAHAAGDKVILGVGGEGSGATLSIAISNSVRSTFINNLLTLVRSRDYDGLDIDMEPINVSDEANFEKFIYELRGGMNKINPNLLLTAAASPETDLQPKMFAKLQNDFDQINIMTYDLSGTWEGWKTWYNSPLFGTNILMTGNVAYPSVTGVLKQYIDAGTPKSKLGIGIAFYGYIWSGADGPMQGIEGVTTTTVGYNQIMDRYFTPNADHWDAIAHAPYLSIPASQTTPKEFVSYDNARLCIQKVVYARQHDLGGVTIFEIGDGYRPGQPEGKNDSLLQTVKSAWRSPLALSIQQANKSPE
jgi:chitinase